MKKITVFAALCLTACLFVTPSFAEDRDNDHQNVPQKGCRNVSGKAVWNLIPAPGDALGRVLGPTTGDLKGAVSAYLTDLKPQPDHSLVATSVETWSFGPGDLLIFNGLATFTPIAGPVGTVSDSLILTVDHGTGIYAGATGVIKVVGTGYNLFPTQTVGQTYFVVSYQGNICTK